MAVSIVNARAKTMIVSDWNTGRFSKAALANRYSVSARTIGRILAEHASQAVKPAVKTVAKPAAKPAMTVSQARDALKKKAAPVAKKAPAAPVAEIQWLMGPNFINLIQDGKTYTADSTHPSFKAAAALLVRASQATTKPQEQALLQEALVAVNVKRAVQKFMQGQISIVGDVVSYKGLQIDNGLTQRILKAMADGKDFKFLINFFENLMLNPSRRAVNELFGFLQHNDIELTEDGHFLAWKRVNSNYTDMYTGRISNKPGSIVEVDRNQVDEDPNRTCSHGLHVAAKSYLPSYGGGRGVVVQVKVHPRDVVAVPTDYNNAKMRTCRYYVMKDVTAGFSHY